jgi:hypothetical protein
LGNSGADNPSDSPVSRNERYPEEFSLLGGERWGVEEFLEDFYVGDFYADVAV